MNIMQDFKKVIAWQKAHQFTLAVYKMSDSFPKTERYGLTSQLHRASMSIPTNIAEGCGRHSQKELANFLNIAMGSASEVEYQLLLARDLAYLADTTYDELHGQLLEVKRVLWGFTRQVRSKL